MKHCYIFPLHTLRRHLCITQRNSVMDSIPPLTLNLKSQDPLTVKKHSWCSLLFVALCTSDTLHHTHGTFHYCPGTLLMDIQQESDADWEINHHLGQRGALNVKMPRKERHHMFLYHCCFYKYHTVKIYMSGYKTSSVFWSNISSCCVWM